MKGFERKNQLFSLCGLNCGLCPMLLGNYCGGCGNGNQSCKIARCSLEHGKIEYCYECRQYPCEKYQHIDNYDISVSYTHLKHLCFPAYFGRGTGACAGIYEPRACGAEKAAGQRLFAGIHRGIAFSQKITVGGLI